MDVYIDNVSKKIRNFIKQEEYVMAGEYFMDLRDYGIEMGNDMLVFLSSELSDIYRYSLIRVKEYIDDIDVAFVEELKSKTFKLIEFMSDMPQNLTKKDLIIEVFERLKFIIYHGERLQYKLNKIERARFIRKRRFSDLK